MAADNPEFVDRSFWAGGRYQAVADHIADIAEELVEIVDDRLKPVSGRDVLDLACGTGTAARALAARGAAVTGVDLTPELIEQARAVIPPPDHTIRWVVADAAQTGLPSASVEAVVSNMGVIFVPIDDAVREMARLLRSDGVMAVSAWVRAHRNPFYDPIVSVLGPQARSPRGGPDDWGEAETVRDHLADDFDTVEIGLRVHHWTFASVDDAMHFVVTESPIHVDLLHRVDEVQRDRLVTAFEAAFTTYVTDHDTVEFQAPYVVITARRR